MQSRQPITHARKDRNLFILTLATPIRIMQVIDSGQLTHLVSKNKKVRVWHWRFRQISNAQIVRASKLFNNIGDLSNMYNLTKIYSDFEWLNSNKSDFDDNDNHKQYQPKRPNLSDTKQDSLNNDLNLDHCNGNIPINLSAKTSQLTNNLFDNNSSRPLQASRCK